FEASSDRVLAPGAGPRGEPRVAMSGALVDYFRCPGELLPVSVRRNLSPQPGYFAFGGAVGYGRHCGDGFAVVPDADLADLTTAARTTDRGVALPFDIDEVV